MSIFRSLSNAIQAPLDAITDSAESLNSGINILNHYVAVNHEQITSDMTNQAQATEARKTNALAEELKADANLKKAFDALNDKYAKFR